MISPTELMLRRLALRLPLEAVAFLAGASPELIRRNERATSIIVYPTHVEAIERLERWNDEFAERLIAAVIDAAGESMIADSPVIWVYGDEAFDRYCPAHFKAACMGLPSLFRLAAADAYATMIEGGTYPHVAELIPAKYAAFLAELDAQDSPVMRLKWWRHWSAQYKMAGGVS